MPTVTAIALDNLLEPGSSSSSNQNQRRHTTSVSNNSGHPPSSSLDKDPRRRNSATANAASSPKPQHHLHLGGGREQQQQPPPVFFSRQQQRTSPAATSDNNGRRRKVDVDVGGGNGRATAADDRSHLPISRYYISPKLYAVSQTTRIVSTGSAAASSPTLSDLSPSPYVVNHKRRGVSRPPPSPPPPPLKPSASDNGSGAEGDAEMRPPLPGRDQSLGGGVAGELTAGTGGESGDGPGEGVGGGGGQRGQGGSWRTQREEEDPLVSTRRSEDDALDENKDLAVGIHNEEGGDDFFDPREVMSTVSSSDTEDGSSFRRTGSGRYHSPLGNQSEFYDASEEFFSEGSVSRSSPSFRASIEADLCSLRLNLLEEIDRRKKAEEALAFMQNMFQRIARQLSPIRLSVPPMQPGEEVQYDVDIIAQFCQELVVTRFVFEAIEIGMANAEAQAAAEAVIQAKNHEIARLRDRLQYYEAMNREMSQRNQAAIELARHRRLKRKMWGRWAWGCGGLLITAGASLLAYSYLSHGCGSPSLASSECHDSSSETM